MLKTKAIENIKSERRLTSPQIQSLLDRKMGHLLLQQ